VVDQTPMICSTCVLTAGKRGSNTMVFGGQNVQKAFRGLTNVANALMQVGQKRFATEFLPLIVEDNALDLASSSDAAFAQSGHEHVVLPLDDYGQPHRFKANAKVSLNDRS
jgi:hypothetical protein